MSFNVHLICSALQKSYDIFSSTGKTSTCPAFKILFVTIELLETLFVIFIFVLAKASTLNIYGAESTKFSSLVPWIKLSVLKSLFVRSVSLGSALNFLLLGASILLISPISSLIGLSSPVSYTHLTLPTILLV